jgi:hypothetical protein
MPSAIRKKPILFMDVPPRQREVESNRNRGTGQDGQNTVGRLSGYLVLVLKWLKNRRGRGMRSRLKGGIGRPPTISG